MAIKNLNIKKVNIVNPKIINIKFKQSIKIKNYLVFSFLTPS